eukprot:gene6355-12853_t
MLRDVLGNEKVEELSENFAEYVEKLKILGWKDVRPWKDFIAVIKPPQMNYRYLEQRMTTNFLHYRSNYAIICLGLFTLRVIFTPILFLTLTLCISFSTYLILIHKRPIIIGDFKIDGNKKVLLASVVSFLLMILTGALAEILWGLIYSILVCGLHMALRPRSVTSKANKLYDELKLTGFTWFGGKDERSDADSKDIDPENPDADNSPSSRASSTASDSVRKRTNRAPSVDDDTNHQQLHGRKHG